MRSRSDPKLGNQMFPAYGNLGPFPVSTLSFIAVIESENPLDPYVQTWTLSVERELPKNTTLEVNYIGNHGTHLLDRRDIAQAISHSCLQPVRSASSRIQSGNYINLGRGSVLDFEPTAVSELHRLLHRQRLPRLLPLQRRRTSSSSIALMTWP